MKAPHAILIGLSLIAAAIFARDVVPSATAAPSETGRYAVSGSGDPGKYWKINTTTGIVSSCDRTGFCVDLPNN